MFGYDWPRLHAALNDLPAALLLVAVLFDLAGLRRPVLRVAGYWTMVAGAIGGILAVVSGLQAEEHIAHGEAVHRVMETHETLGLVTLGIFAVITLWRILREHRMGGSERAEGHHHHGGEGEEPAEHDDDHDHASPAADPTTPAPASADSSKPAGHTHAPGTPPHKD